MKLKSTIQALRERCPSLGQRVFGSAEFAQLQLERYNASNLPSAYVFTLAENPTEPQRTENSYYQEIVATVAVVILIDNSSDRRGQNAADKAEDLKEEVFKALLSWSPLAKKNTQTKRIENSASIYTYSNYRILALTPAVLAVQLEFECEYAINESDTRQRVELDALGRFNEVDSSIRIIGDDNEPVTEPVVKTKFKDLW